MPIGAPSSVAHHALVPHAVGTILVDAGLIAIGAYVALKGINWIKDKFSSEIRELFTI